MRTHMLKATPSSIQEAAGLLRAGQVVAFPTETVYGLGANALEARAVRRIFAAKGRPADNPLIVHVSSRAMASRVAKDVPPLARRLMRAFWPGPLTLVLPKSRIIPGAVTAGLSTVAVRMPAHHVALALIRAARAPIAAPSANRSGHVSPTRARHVLADLGGRIPLILDGGPCRIGVESTVLDLTQDPPAVLRPGGLSLERLRRIIPDVRVQTASRRPASPGMKYRHYAPRTPLLLVESSRSAKAVSYTLHARFGPSARIAVICPCDSEPTWKGLGVVVPLGRTPAEMARRLFATLRRLKAFDVIVAELPPKAHLGWAVRNRLRKASVLRL